jgi:hypothetical protein
MTYGPAHPDPNTELLCSDRELEQAGFSIGYSDEMPDVDSEFISADGSPLGRDTDAFFATLDLEDPLECARAADALRQEAESEGASSS